METSGLEVNEVLANSDVSLSNEASESEPTIEDNADVNESPASSHPLCSSCKVPLIPQGESRKPSWAKVMSSVHRPAWYCPCKRCFGRKT